MNAAVASLGQEKRGGKRQNAVILIAVLAAI
jgi:hypothetical protein